MKRAISVKTQRRKKEKRGVGEVRRKKRERKKKG